MSFWGQSQYLMHIVKCTDKMPGHNNHKKNHGNKKSHSVSPNNQPRVTPTEHPDDSGNGELVLENSQKPELDIASQETSGVTRDGSLSPQVMSPRAAGLFGVYLTRSNVRSSCQRGFINKAACICFHFCKNFCNSHAGRVCMSCFVESSVFECEMFVDWQMHCVN